MLAGGVVLAVVDFTAAEHAIRLLHKRSSLPKSVSRRSARSGRLVAAYWLLCWCLAILLTLSADSGIS